MKSLFLLVTAVLKVMDLCSVQIFKRNTDKTCVRGVLGVFIPALGSDTDHVMSPHLLCVIY